MRVRVQAKLGYRNCCGRFYKNTTKTAPNNVFIEYLTTKKEKILFSELFSCSDGA